MAADDQIKCSVQILRHTRSNQRILVQGPIDYSLLDETSPEKIVYLNGGSPDGGGFTYHTPNVAFESGEYIIVQVKNRNTSSKTLDSTGSSSGLLVMGVRKLDKNTGTVYADMVTEADRSTDLFADDPACPSAKWQDGYAIKVPDGERWSLYGLLQANLRTTA